MNGSQRRRGEELLAHASALTQQLRDIVDRLERYVADLTDDAEGGDRDGQDTRVAP